MQHGTPAGDTVETQTPERRELTRGQRVRIARIARGWTQRELAAEAGLLERTVSLVEQDHTTLRDKTIFKLSLALDLNVEDLRLRVLGAVDSGKPREELAKTFSVSMPTIKRWLKRRRETGDMSNPSRSLADPPGKG